MQLIEIDKNTYRSHLNTVIVAAVAVFSALGVSISALLIHWFGAAQGQNFYLELTRCQLSPARLRLGVYIA